MAAPAGNQPRPYAQAVGYQPNGAPAAQPMPGAIPLAPNQGRVIQQGAVRVLCIADVRGNLRSLNQLARDARADYVVHTGDFGFYDERSLDRIAEKTLRHVAQYSPLLSEHVKRQIAQSPAQPSIKDRIPRDQLPLSELPSFLNKTFTLDVPVYTVWGACEDVQVLEKLRSGEYNIHNLHIIDESHSRLLDIGGVKLRLLGLGGAVVMHKLFDNGEGRTTIAGGQGTMWTTLLQMGELVDTANRVYDPTETRIFISHASPTREGLLNQLSVTLKADFSISAGLHFRYGSSYNEFSVNPTLDHYRGKLAASRASFDDVWQTVKTEVEPAVEENESQKRLLAYALDLVSKMPIVANGGNPFGGQSTPGSGQIDESAFKNMWNFNLADAAYGWLVLDVEGGRIGTEMRAQGFNFAHRGGKTQAQAQAQQTGQTGQTPVVSIPNTPLINTPAATGGNLATQGGTVPPSRPAQNQPRQSGPPPVAQNQNVQGNRAGGPQATRTGPSPQHIGPKDAPKSGTPQLTGNEKSMESKTNGTSVQEKGADPFKEKDAPLSERRGPSQALFVRNAESDEGARNLLAEQDRDKIERVESKGTFHIVHFKTADEMRAALSRVAADLKQRQTDPSKPSVAIYKDMVNTNRREHHGAGNWQASSRGGAQSGPGGYRSGGASDSEGGRGGFRGRGGRGRGDRGDRDGGRGDRGGRGRGGPRGGMKGAAAEGASGTDPKPTPATTGGET